MKTKERIVIYATLLTLGLLVLGSPLTGTVNAAALLQELLGPTDGVSLRQAEGDNLILTAKSGRLSTGDSAYQRVYSVAVCDIVSIVQEYMKQPQILDELNAQVERAREEISRKQQDLQKLAEAMEITTDPNRRQGIMAQGQQLQQELQMLNNQAIGEQNQMRGNYMIEAYDKIVAAVDAISDRDKIDLVLTTRDTSLAIEETNPNQILTNILARTAVRYPGEIDITPAVLAELDLTVATEPEASDAGAAEGG